MKNQVSWKTYLGTVLILIVLLGASVWGATEIEITDKSFVSDYSYLVGKDGSTTYMQNGVTGEVDWSSTDSSAVINAALGNLTSGRAWKEKVVFKGEFEIDYNAIDRQIMVPNYTILDFASSLIKVKDGTGCDGDYGIFRNSGPCTDIEIIGLSFDENAVGAPDGWAELVWLKEPNNILIRDCNFSSPTIGYGLRLEPTSGIDPTGSNIIIENCVFNYNDVRVHAHETTFKDNILDNTNVYFYGRTHVTTNTVVGISKINCYYRDSVVDGNTFICTPNYFALTVGGLLQYPQGNTIVSDNIFRGDGTKHAIQIGSGFENGTIIGNVITDCNIGIALFNVNSKNTVVTENTITNCTEGIRFEDVDFCRVTDNTMINCTYALFFHDVGDHPPRGNIIEGNYFLNCTNIRGWFTDEATDEGSNTYKRNFGYVTENSETQICANNENVTHGLAGTPTYIDVTPMNDTYDSVPVIATVDWTYVDATNIQVGLYWVNGTAISDDVILVSWYAEYEP